MYARLLLLLLLLGAVAGLLDHEFLLITACSTRSI